MNMLIISSADIRKCPVHSLSPSHYYRISEDEIGCHCPQEHPSRYIASRLYR
jgi:hypothetical protein